MQRSSCIMAKAAVPVIVSRVVPVPAPLAGGYAAVHEKLSFLDAPWVATPPLQQVYLYLYELAGGGGGHEFPALVRRLKESLAATLALYLPLAGKLTYAAETGDVVVDCSDAGVDFFEAEADGDVRRLAGDGDGGARDVPAFLILVPEHDARVLPAAVLRVQVTRLGVGEGARAAGLALGVSLHHAVADGLAMALFVGAWASACRGGSPVLPRPLGPPEHGRNAVAHAHPRGQDLARAVLSKVAPNLPVANEMEDYLSHRARLARRAFTLGADHVRSLKRRINELASRASATAGGGGGGKQPRPKPVSSFVAVSALCWTAFVRANGLAAGADAHLAFQVDLRARLRPPVGVGYSGNCIRGCLASADAGELVDGEAGLLHASRAVRAAVAEVEAAPVAGMASWVDRAMRLPPSRVACVAGGPVFRVYETNDFGFGRPGCVEPVSMAGSPRLRKNGDADDSVNGGEGTIVLYAGKGDGEVYVSVSLDPKRVDAFKAHIISDGVRPRI